MEVDGIKFIINENMLQYPFGGVSPKISTDDDLETKHIFFVDTCSHDAFSHWVFESAIFLPYFNKLNNMLDDKLYLHFVETDKSYKKLFIDVFGIPETKIIKTLSKNNKCYMQEYAFLLQNKNESEEHKKKFIELITNFRNKILEKIDNNSIDKKYNLLYLPRQKTGNYVPNDFQITNQDNIIKMVSEYKKNIIFDTINTMDILCQFSLVRNSKNILLNYSSPLFVNGFFAINSNILILNCFHHNHHTEFTYLKIIYDIIALENNTYFIPCSNNKNNVTVDENNCKNILDKFC